MKKCCYVTKNDHFFKLCPEGQLRPGVSNEKVYVCNEKRSLSKVMSWGQLDPPLWIKGAPLMELVAKMLNEVAEILKCCCRNTEVLLQKILK